MIDGGQRSVLGVLVSAVDYEAAVDKIVTAAQEGRSLAVSALAVHGVMTGVLDKTHLYRLNNLDVIVPDGQPVRWALNLLHRSRLRDRVYGPTLMLKVCRRAASEGLPIYLFGSRSAVLDMLGKNLRRMIPGLAISGSQPSAFRCVSVQEKEETARRIVQSGARITFVGLGCPRQEVWGFENRDLLPMPVIAVGAAFDFHAGTLSQAPGRMQRLGLEWFFRFLKEPRRLWRRYLFLNPTYLALLFLQAVRPSYFGAARACPPAGEMRYG